MNIIMHLVTALLSISSCLSFSYIQKQPKFILHFDVNKTILADDPAGGKSIDDVLIACLAEKYKDRWDASLETPITYTAYVKNYLLPGEKSDQKLKKLRNKKISDFITFLKDVNHPLHTMVQSEFDALKNKLNNNDSIIFNSVYELIRFLEAKNIEFTIILRTFGDDLPRVIADINSYLKKPFFTQHGSFKHGMLHLEKSTLESIPSIYGFFKESCHIAIQDNWKEWNDHNEAQEYAKRFPINIHDKEVISMFFDDNVETDPTLINNIVNPIDSNTGKSMSVKDLIETNNIVVVDTISAILDDNYFVTKVMNHLA